MTPHALAELRDAKRRLERSSFAARVTRVLDAPIARGLARLPPHWSSSVTNATHVALTKALVTAIATIDPGRLNRPSNLMHKVAAAATGAAGGAFGLVALPIELPVSTAVMLRSIADVARSEGERIETVDARLACLEVFALGGSTPPHTGEPRYFAVRVALARAVTEAAEFIAERGLVREGAPAIVRLIAQIASRFGAAVSEKVAAQAIPVIGAAGGAIVNLMFIDHFQDLARGHFVVRRLERVYGADVVRDAYTLQLSAPSTSADVTL
jgi:hypothetical protein